MRSIVGAVFPHEIVVSQWRRSGRLRQQVRRHAQRHRTIDAAVEGAIGHLHQQDIRLVAPKLTGCEPIHARRPPRLRRLRTRAADPLAIEPRLVEVVDRAQDERQFLVLPERRHLEFAPIPEVAHAVVQAIVAGAPPTGHRRRDPRHGLKSSLRENPPSLPALGGVGV